MYKRTRQHALLLQYVSLESARCQARESTLEPTSAGKEVMAAQAVQHDTLAAGEAALL